MKTVKMPKTMKVPKIDRISLFEDRMYSTVKCPHCDHDTDAKIKNIVFTASIDGDIDEQGDRIYGYDGHDHAFLKLQCANPRCKKEFLADYYKSDCLSSFDHLLVLNANDKEAIKAFKDSVKESYDKQAEKLAKLSKEAKKKKAEYIKERFTDAAKMCDKASKTETGKAIIATTIAELKSHFILKQ